MPDAIETIEVHTAPAYEVAIGPGLLAQCGQYLRSMIEPLHMAVVTDSIVAPLYLDAVAASLQSAGFSVSTHVFAAGEPHKNFETLSEILEFLGGRPPDPHRLRGGSGRRCHRRHGRLCRRLLSAGHPLCAAAHHAACRRGLLRGGKDCHRPAGGKKSGGSVFAAHRRFVRHGLSCLLAGRCLCRRRCRGY